jgi:hypothetical protein
MTAGPRANSHHAWFDHVVFHCRCGRLGPVCFSFVGIHEGFGCVPTCIFEMPCPMRICFVLP